MELSREDILTTLGRIATSDPGDAIALALDTENADTAQRDLWGVSEFKRGSGNAAEVKFVDRIKAIELLLNSLSDGGTGMRELMEALAVDEP